LIEPAGKSPAGYRLYDKDSARRLRFIRHAQECGFTLAEIRELLVLRGHDAARCGDVRKRVVEKKRELESKIRSMRTMCKALDRLIADCVDETRPVEGCAILATFEQPETTARTN
jgi:DNA-binding transcriptional MerR regulator